MYDKDNSLIGLT